jgi:hypothetical protein
MKYNRELKTIDTQEKAYLLGLYYSDGFIYRRKDGYGSHTGVTLHLQDEYMLDRLTQDFPFFQKRYDKSKTTTAQLRGNYQKLYDDLFENGVLPQKSTKNRLNLNFPNLKEELKPHFIRGFFDGDGSVYMNKTNSPNSKGISFVGTCKYFMQQLQLELEKVGVKFTTSEPDLSKYSSVIQGRVVLTKTPIIKLQLSNRAGIELFTSYLYNNSKIHLSRKYNLMIKWFETLPPRTACKNCGSSNTLYNGKNRIICKDCNKITPIVGSMFVKMETKLCKHCDSKNTVGHGYTKSRVSKKVISQIFLCQECNRTSSYKLMDCPLTE